MLVRMNWLLFLLVVLGPALGSMSDVDQADTQSDTSSTADIENMDDAGSDPNLLNPLRGQGYGLAMHNYNWKLSPTGAANKNSLPTTPKPTLSQQSMRAILEFGIIVGVAIMVGVLFMAMVGMEIMCDRMADKYREFFKKPKLVPDVERLHPAELVGTFSRYK